MTEQVKPKGKPGRKPKAVVEPKVVVETQELAKIEIVDGEKVVTDLEPVAEAPVTPSTDVDVVTLGDVSNTPAEAPVIEAPELVATTVIETPAIEKFVEVVSQRIADEIDAEIVQTVLDEKFKPILRPTNVKGEAVGHMPVPKAIFELVTKDSDWRSKIEKHNAKVGLQSVLYWLNKNGELRVRCMSSSRFGDVV